jgi:hypothetical protein
MTVTVTIDVLMTYNTGVSGKNPGVVITIYCSLVSRREIHI